MKRGAVGRFGAQLKALREAAGFTQEELATIAGLSVHAISALERGERRRPHVETVRALSAALDLTGAARDALVGSARAPASEAAVDELSDDALPLALTGLVGREADLRILRPWLGDPAVRLITLVGPGGVGKTRLVLELARGVASEGVVRVVFVPLAAIWNPVFVTSAIAEALGLSDVTAIDLPLRARVACADHPTLLVLDNFEQVLDAAPLVADLLTRSLAPGAGHQPRPASGARGAGVRRRAARARAGADGLSPADLARSPAVRLFVERVRDVQPAFRLTAANAATVSAICRRLDALPLALELAAPWLKVLTVDDCSAASTPTCCSRPSPRAAISRSVSRPSTPRWPGAISCSNRTSSACSATSASCPVCFRSTQRRRSLPAPTRRRQTPTKCLPRSPS